jgi:iron(III) transport system ATP-binding protein
MAVSDRIAVMQEGVIHQIGTPKELYQRPQDLFVSNFIGRSNAIKAALEIQNGTTRVVFPNGAAFPVEGIAEEHKKNQNLCVSIRPEEFIISPAEGLLKAVVETSIFLGLNTYYFAQIETGEHVEIIQESTIDNIIPKGASVFLNVKREKINIFPEDGSRNLLVPGV